MKLLTGFQSALLICWFETKTGIHIAEYLCVLMLGVYVVFRLGWRNMLRLPIDKIQMRI